MFRIVNNAPKHSAFPALGSWKEIIVDIWAAFLFVFSLLATGA